MEVKGGVEAMVVREIMVMMAIMGTMPRNLVVEQMEGMVVMARMVAMVVMVEMEVMQDILFYPLTHKTLTF